MQGGSFENHPKDYNVHSISNLLFLAIDDY